MKKNKRELERYRRMNKKKERNQKVCIGNELCLTDEQ